MPNSTVIAPLRRATFVPVVLLSLGVVVSVFALNFFFIQRNAGTQEVLFSKDNITDAFIGFLGVWSTYWLVLRRAQERTVSLRPENVKLLQSLMKSTPEFSELLTKQLDQVKQTSEDGIMSLMIGLKTVDEQIAMLSGNLNESRGRSKVMQTSAESIIAESAKHISQFREYSQKRVENLAQDDSAIRKMIGQLESLKPLAGAIRKLASQSNMLALNATIEAARAGDMGKGFAVVAEEVRDLGKQVDSTASRISEEVSAIAQMATHDLADLLALSRRDDERTWLQTMQDETERLTDNLQSAVSELANVSGSAAEAATLVRSALLDSLGHVQFQDITRQQVELVQTALGQLSEQVVAAVQHASDPARSAQQTERSIDGAANIPLFGDNAVSGEMLLDTLVDDLKNKYTMQSQHLVHSSVAGETEPEEEEVRSAIELF